MGDDDAVISIVTSAINQKEFGYNNNIRLKLTAKKIASPGMKKTGAYGTLPCVASSCRLV